ncbi:hypothetical protein D9615_003490, partial [Tricholomella constricta]
HEFKLQSIAVVGARRLEAFASYLATIPATSRRVRHLFISIIRDRTPRKSKCRLFKHRICDFWEHERRTSGILNQILKCISPTLETLHLISNIPRTSVLVSIPLPRLYSLTIHGPMHIYDHLDDKLPIFPSLRQLTLKSFTEYPAGMLHDISRQAPSLNGLSFALERPLAFLPLDLSRALDHESTQEPTVPPSLNQISVHHGIGQKDKENVWIRAAQRVMLENLSKVVEMDNRVKVVGLKQLHTYHEAKTRWLQDCDSR